MLSVGYDRDGREEQEDLLRKAQFFTKQVISLSNELNAQHALGLVGVLYFRLTVMIALAEGSLNVVHFLTLSSL